MLNVFRLQVHSIKRTDVEGALPVQTIDRAAIDRSGLATAGDLIQSTSVYARFHLLTVILLVVAVVV